MSGKNRAFALAVATAALVGLSAPVASAATFSGPSGYNNDSVVNLSGNQVPLQACNDYIPVNALGGQLDLASIVAALGLLSSGNQKSSNNTSCTQNPTESNTTTISATSATPSASASSTTAGPADATAADTTSGLNNDSVVNLSGNQVPAQACNNNLPLNAAGVQGLANGLVPAVGILSTGDVSATQDSSCTQNPAGTNTSSVTSSN